MIRRLTLAALIAAATLGGLAAAPAAAYPPVGHDHDHDRHDHRTSYRVLIRHRGHWDEYRTYRDRDDAVRAARRLEWRGYDVRVERTRGR